MSLKILDVFMNIMYLKTTTNHFVFIIISIPTLYLYTYCKDCNTIILVLFFFETLIKLMFSIYFEHSNNSNS